MRSSSRVVPIVTHIVDRQIMITPIVRKIDIPLFTQDLLGLLMMDVPVDLHT